MIVDDSAFMRKVVTDLLEQMPHIKVAAAARNGKQALDHLAKESFDLVVMDVEMPVLDGLETLRMIKRTVHRSGNHAQFNDKSRNND